MLGDGSDGELYVAAGQTVNLSLNHKYQFTSVTVEPGGTISTTDTVGAVLYIAAQNFIRIGGSIVLNGKLNPGHTGSSITIDGLTYTSPGSAVGGVGGSWVGQVAAPQGGGFGGGGAGGAIGSVYSSGGAGGATPGGGGAGNGSDTGDTSNNTVYANGNNGGTSSGGGGASYAFAQTTSGASRSRSIGYAGGTGGTSHGQNGANGANPPGTFFITYEANDGSQITYDYGSAGGGGAGGAAGRPGIHLTLRSSEVHILSTAAINVSGSPGGAGGNGGITYFAGGPTGGGLGGGGGGGGNSGTCRLFYGTVVTTLGPVTRSGGAGGIGGAQGYTGTRTGQNGAGGAAGNYFANRSSASYGNMIHMFN